MYETFDQRRSRLLAAPLPEPEFITGKELLEEPTPPSSEDRLLELPADSWTPAVFAQATREFLQETVQEIGFGVFVHKGSEALPPLGPEVRYKYSGKRGPYKKIAKRAADGEELLVATVQEREHVIG